MHLLVLGRTEAARAADIHDQSKLKETAMSRRILVTAATGETGRYTTELLISQGFEVRAPVHNADERSEKLKARGAEVVVGDLLDFDAVRGATRGVNTAYFVYPIRPGLIDATSHE
jgi:uncharacterized protein YbjT (DUF2867 family)